MPPAQVAGPAWFPEPRRTMVSDQTHRSLEATVPIPDDAPRSEDGHYWWDGTQWQLVDQADAGGAAAGSGSSAGSAAGSTPTAPDPAGGGGGGGAHPVFGQLQQWYDGLDQTSKAIVDALTAQGLAHLLADPEVGVVQSGGEELAQLDQNPQALGSALAAQGGGSGTATA